MTMTLRRSPAILAVLLCACTVDATSTVNAPAPAPTPSPGQAARSVAGADDQDPVCPAHDTPSGGQALRTEGPTRNTVDLDGWSSLVERPIAALIVRNAWIDYREPTFVLYEDGRVIWQAASGTREGRLDAGEVARLYATLDGAGVSKLPVYAD